MNKKVILITGASTGIGKDTALRYIQEGHIVYGAARSLEKMHDIVTAGGHALQLDITDQASIEACISTIVKNEGKIDVLFNNAGYGEYGAVEDVSMERARYQFEVNLFGLASITKEVLPIMRKQKSGLIINTSSIGGKIYTPFGAWYHATKHALEGWSDSLRLEVKPFGIHVVLLEPGSIDTPWNSIMANNLVHNSQQGPYAKMVQGWTKLAGNFKSSPVSVIGKLMIKILNAKNPKPRYMKGSGSGLMINARKILGDRGYDKLLIFLMK
jgi:short-subunit dehydrogenase